MPKFPTLEDGFDFSAWEPIPYIEGTCRGCGSREGVAYEDARTCYSGEPHNLWTSLIYEDNPPDPNAPILLCRDCAHDHHAYWDELWQEYYQSR